MSIYTPGFEYRENEQDDYLLQAQKQLNNFLPVLKIAFKKS